MASDDTSADARSGAARPVVVVTHRVHDEVLARLRESCTVIANQEPRTLPRAEILRRCAAADALLAFMPDRVDDDFLRACPRLRVIGAALKGYDNFDVRACARRGVCLTFVPDLLTAPTAELAIGLTIGLIRQLRAADAFVRSGAFSGWTPGFYGLGIEGATLGLLGFGAIGRAIAARLRGWNCRLLCADRRPLPATAAELYGAEPTAVDRLLSTSDILLLGLPLTPDTRHYLDRAALAKLKPGAFLVNPCRGSVVDEGAVLAALHSGSLAGYAADVFAMEDWALADRPATIDPALLAHPNTLFSAHLGSAVDSVRLAIERRAADNILHALAGTVPADVAVAGD